MQIVRNITWDDIINHWVRVEEARAGCTKTRDVIKFEIMNNNFVLDIMPFIDSVDWVEAVIEPQDINELFVISSCDWYGFSNSYKLQEIYDHYINKNYSNPNRNTSNKSMKIDALQNGLKTQQDINRHLIMLCSQISGYYTIIDGCHRAVALHCLSQLVGNSVYLGISPHLICKNYRWVCH